MKSVGERSAGNPHAAFDERGGETGPYREPAPLLDSTRLGACLRIGHGAACRLFDRDVGLVGGRVGVGGNGVEGDTRPRFTVRRAAS
jgi:hypothetical protein